MGDNYIKIKDVLEIIFITTNKKANILADTYLIKNPSIISKWKSNKVIPTENDILIIVDFAMSESTDSQRKIMRERLEKLIMDSNINDDLKSVILSMEDFKSFLSEILSICASIRLHNTNCESIETVKKIDYTSLESNANKITAFSENTPDRYSGVLEFDMLLTKDGGNGFVGKISKSDILIKKGNNSSKDHNILGKLYNKAKSKSFISTIVIGIISTFFVIQIANSQIPLSTPVIYEERQNDSFPYEEYLRTKYWDKAEEKATFLQNQLTSNEQKLTEEETNKEVIEEQAEKQDNSQKEEIGQKVIHNQTNNDTIKNDTENSESIKLDKTQNNIDGVEGNTTIITNINGDRNINVIGDNIYIHME
ncbi:UNVERIFIED_CONTAM: hypothetical protein Cloal_1360 [Acetivibrio alkalicellulosi]